MKPLLIFALASGAAFAQEYVAVKSTTLAGTAEVITVQQPASGARTVRFRGAYIDCSVACTITIERNGTAATTTTLTPAQINPSVAVPAVATAFSASNVGVGTVISPPSGYSIPASGSQTYDLSSLFMAGSGTGKNLTIRTNAITGNVNIIIKWQEVTP